MRMSEPLPPGLHIVATPIGNLGDLSPRAADTLRRADRILVEDTRITAKLLAHIGAKVPMTRYDDHSSESAREAIVARLAQEAIALVSDAGTPLISDPGFKLVRAARAAGHAVHTIPGPCAAIAALTLAGLPTRSAGATKNALAGVMNASAVLLFVTSPQVHWREAFALGAGAIVGGLMGSWALQRVNEKALRIAIVCIGAGLTVGLFLKPL